ncbi:MAG: hypothetical protein AMXMBFR84_31480 [Candidatus Hydrogenedentota bacterium]
MDVVPKVQPILCENASQRQRRQIAHALSKPAADTGYMAKASEVGNGKFCNDTKGRVWVWAES